MIKVIASDMDGTLLNSKHQISEGNIKAIKKAKELGVKFIIATGRRYEDVESFIDEHDIECEYILMNGAEYRNSNGEIQETINIDKNKVKVVLEKISKENLSTEIYTNKGIYTVNTKEEALEGMVNRLKQFEKVDDNEKALELAKKHSHYVNLNYIENIDEFIESDIEVRKIITFYDDVELINRVKDELSKVEDIAVLSSFVTNIEVTNIKAQKGFILSKVIKKMGISNDEVMAAGDSFNDYSLFTEFKNAFAMENAIPEIKELANNITDTNDNDGVAKAIYKVLGII